MSRQALDRSAALTFLLTAQRSGPFADGHPSGFGFGAWAALAAQHPDAARLASLLVDVAALGAYAHRHLAKAASSR